MPLHAQESSLLPDTGTVEQLEHFAGRITRAPQSRRARASPLRRDRPPPKRHVLSSVWAQDVRPALDPRPPGVTASVADPHDLWHAVGWHPIQAGCWPAWWLSRPAGGSSTSAWVRPVSGVSVSQLRQVPVRAALARSASGSAATPTAPRSHSSTEARSSTATTAEARPWRRSIRRWRRRAGPRSW